MRLWGIRVLVYDEEQEALRHLTDVLRREGGAAIHVTSAHQALATIVGVSPDVMVVAVDRPALDPNRLMRLVRTLSPEKGGRTPAVSLSALPALEVDWRGRCDHTPFQGHLERPGDPERFVELVSDLAGQWVERRHAQVPPPEWPHELQRERRREVRTAVPTEAQYLEVVRDWLRSGRPGAESD
jgi:CheY-like chemotaxis protein